MACIYPCHLHGLTLSPTYSAFDRVAPATALRVLLESLHSSPAEKLLGAFDEAPVRGDR